MRLFYSTQSSELSRNWLICIIAAAAMAFTLKIILAWNTYGTNDVLTWEQDLRKFDAKGPIALYREGVQSFSPTGKPYHEQAFIHPPFIIHALRFWQLLAITSHLPIGFWMRFTCALADIGSLIVISQIAKQLPAPKLRPAMLLLFAVCPISILVSGFHGNTDALMMFPVLLSIYVIESRKPPLLAGAVMGLALSIKLAPVIFIPVMVFYFSRLRDRIIFLSSSCIIFVGSGLPYILLDPLLIFRKLCGYSSRPGLWGWSRIVLLFEHSTDNRWIYENFEAHAKAMLIISIMLIAVGVNWSRVRLPLFAQCGLIACLFIFFTPGFAVQYLSWLVPWVVCLTPFAAAAYYLTGAIFIAVVYTHWSRGFPWYLANALEIQDWSGIVVYFGLACWLTTGILVLLFTDTWVKQSRTRSPAVRPAIPSTALR